MIALYLIAAVAVITFCALVVVYVIELRRDAEADLYFETTRLSLLRAMYARGEFDAAQWAELQTRIPALREGGGTHTQ